MTQIIRLLHLEDNPFDAELVAASLKAENGTYQIVVVPGRECFESAVARESFDLILSDYRVPGYDGMAAIRYVRAVRPNTPLIILSGFVGDESAVACLKAGAIDFVLKHNLGRLNLAILRALAESDQQRNREIGDRRYAHLFEFSPDAIVLTDRSGVIVKVNRQFEHIFRWDRAELIGQHVAVLIPPEFDEVRFREYCTKVLAEPDQSACFETVYRRKDGSEFPVEVVLQFITPDQDSGQFIATARDIADRHEKEMHIRAREIAESSNRAKSEFLTSMSHELRTPLNGILGMNELLLNTELTDRQRQFVEVSNTSGKVLLQQINDILDLSKIEAGKLELELQECNLESLVYEITDVFSHNARQKGYTLRCHLDSAVCVTALCDGNRLRQILINLLGNAVKFTASGGVTLRATCVQQQDRQLTVRFCVTDTGIGLPADRRDRLFAPFSQVDSSTSRKFGGTGLGLSICKQLVELMGGQIGVDSQLGVGSTFWFEIPMQVAAETAKIAQRQHLLAGRRVLVVAGLSQEWAQLGDSLRAWECPFMQVAALEGAVEAIIRAEAAGVPFAVVLVDCRLIVTDEYLPLQTQVELCQLPVIGLAANPAREVVAMVRPRGVQPLLHDPIRPSALFDTLTSALAIATSPPEATAIAEELPTAFTGHILVAEDNDINQMFVRELLEYSGITCDIVNNGDEALTALRNKPYDLVLMDCQMPEMDGFTASREIRRREAVGELIGRLPIIALTANALKGDQQRCLDAGMDDYLTKPLKAAKLNALLAKFALRPPHNAMSGRGPEGRLSPMSDGVNEPQSFPNLNVESEVHHESVTGDLFPAIA
jgi:PAS domain S-box-containing protein